MLGQARYYNKAFRDHLLKFGLDRLLALRLVDNSIDLGVHLFLSFGVILSNILRLLNLHFCLLFPPLKFKARHAVVIVTTSKCSLARGLITYKIKKMIQKSLILSKSSLKYE